MKRILMTIAVAIMAVATLAGRDYRVSTPNSMLVLTAKEGEPLYFRYYGIKADLTDVFSSYRAMKYEAFRAFGTHCSLPSACIIKHADGDNATKLVVDKVEETSTETMNILTVTLKEVARPFKVKLYYKAYKDCDVIKMSAEYINDGKKPIILQKYMSAALPVKSEECWLMHIDGEHGSENNETFEPLTEGVKVLSTMEGGFPSRHNNASFMLGTDNRISETEGNVIAGTLAWTGNFHIEFINNMISKEPVIINAGINPTAADYTLDGKKSLMTPEMIFTYSSKGKGQATRNLHYWARNHHILDGKEQRHILLNSWEGVRMNVTQTGMNSMMDDFAALGGEMFVMDDGWFGNKYARTDSQGLGDWEVCKERLPEGIGKLIEYAHGNNIKFGIWIEPEMTNTTSELFEKHPEWVIKAPERDLVLGRGGTQLVLDLSNPEVQDFIFSIVDDLMTENPDIDYIKWDANMPISNHGSQYLDKKKQSHLYIEYHRGFAKVCERIRAKYPDLTIQACASGGGRANWGVLPWFDEFWVSDNTDALQRVYMQWGTSYFFPAIAMASHISATPNHTVFRTTSLKYRIDVAMSGRLGMEIQPKNMTDEEKDLCRKAIAEYKQIRPVVQFGDIYRLVSPYDGHNMASMMYVDPEKTEAVFYWWKTETFYDDHLPRVKMAGLDPAKSYKVHELNRIDNVPLPYEGKSFSGKFLMENGLEIPLKHRVDYHKQDDWSSRVLYLTAE